MNQTAMEITQAHYHDLHVLAGFGMLMLGLLVMAYFFFLGWVAGRHNGVEREVVRRALQNLAPSEDPIVAKRHAKLLEAYREKPKA